MAQSKMTIALPFKKPRLAHFLSILESPTRHQLQPDRKLSKPAIRSSLQASTFDGVFATFFSCVTGGVLLNNFLLDLGANNLEIGLLAAIPMLMNFLQPVGAFIGDKSTSRHWYTVSIFSISRLLWLLMLLGIGGFIVEPSRAHQLIWWTLGVVSIAHLLAALGSPSWVSWMAALVPHRLRGRYFGIRNSAANCTNLLCLPLLGAIVSSWDGGTIEGYGIVLSMAIAAGAISLVFQFLMADVNPQLWEADEKNQAQIPDPVAASGLVMPAFLKDENFRRFLLYLGLWMFAVNLSAPFFNIYLLKDLELDLSWVTLYNSLAAGANLLMLLLWGKMADRVGNRPILVFVGMLVAIAPLLWLGTDTNGFCLWLWLPLLHLFNGATWAAIDLCGNNIQMEIAPAKQPSGYFAIAAAISGLAGALGTTVGGILTQHAQLGGLPGLFALSAAIRLVALLPLIFVREPRSQTLPEILDKLLQFGVNRRLNCDP